MDEEMDVRDIMHTAAGHEAGDIIEVPEKRVLTYTRTYRIETTLTDEELITEANTASELGFVHNAETVIDAIDAIVYEHEANMVVGTVKVELHNTQFEERDPGFF